MRISGSRTPPPPNPFDEFNGPWSGAAINAQIQALNPLDTIELPARIFTLETIVWDRPLNVIEPPGGTKIFGSLAVRTRPMNPSDPGWAQVSSTVRASVRVVDLRQNGITSWGDHLPFTGPNSTGVGGWFGGNNVTALAPPALICDDRQMELVRWPSPSAVDEKWDPNFEFVDVVTTVNQVFTCPSIPSTWSTANWYGNNLSAVTLYPGYNTESIDYFTSATVAPSTGIVSLVEAVPGSYYGPSESLQGQVRFVIQNVLETLLVAGQYYVDVNYFLLYFIPPDSNPGHSYRVSWANQPLMALQANWVASCSGIEFSGGPLGLYGCRGHGFILQGPTGDPAGALDDITFGSIQAFGTGQDAFGFQNVNGGGRFTNWTISQIVVDWCGGCGLAFGYLAGTGTGATLPPTGFPTLDKWNCNLGSMFFSRTCQWCRAARGAFHAICVDTTVEFISSVQNPNHHLIHDCHDFVVNGGYFDASYTEGADVGVIYSSNDPTTFGTVFNDITILNILPFPYGPLSLPVRSTFPARRGIYIDNFGSGITARNSIFYACESYSQITNLVADLDYCIYINGGQANTIDGVTTIDCPSMPVGMNNPAATASPNPWQPGVLPPHYAYVYYTLANQADGRYATKYGVQWSQMPTSSPFLGAPRNNSILRVTPFLDPTTSLGSTGQPPWNNVTALDFVAVNQPQGAVSPIPLPTVPSKPPPPSW